MANDERGQSGGVNISGGDVKWKGIKTDGDLINGVPSNGIAERHPSTEAETRTTRPERDDSKKLRITYAQFEEKRKALGLGPRQMKEFLDSDGKRWKYGVMNIDFLDFIAGPDLESYVANYDLVESQNDSKQESEFPKSKTIVVEDLGGTGQAVNLNNADIEVKRDVIGGRKIVK